MNDKNRRDDIKIDIISEINDDIIEKNSKRRFELFTKLAERRKKKKKITIACISAAASFMLIFGILLAVIIPTLTKQVPVYQGMTVSGEFPSAQSAKADAENLLPAYMPVSLSLTEPTYINPYNLSTGNGKGNANGHDKNGKTDIPEETVVEQVKDSLNIVGGEKSIYYAEKNQDIYITVHVDNPDSFEILSFTLNGKKYSSYMFEEGSDMENLVLKVNVGDTEGVIDYTIDAIKYIDGTEIKDVRMEGDKTVKVGVATDKQPTAVISSEKIAFNDIFFSITVTDALKLIELSGGRVDAVLYEGDNIIATKSISITEGTGITFDNLKPATEYTYVIAASYDALDGSGFNTYILAAKTFTTLEALMFNNVTVGQENVSFNLLWDEKYIEREIVSISLYQGETKIKDIETTATAIDGLLCDNEYTVIVEYKNNGKTDNVYLKFTTAAKAKPTVAITRSSITQTSVEFGVSFTDTDGVGEISRIELLHRSGNKTAENTAVRSFSGVLSNNTYTVKVT
ncbi:MAG: hypothetical protein IJV72_04745 [Clostridia bacterium]|nr:hypothetical protein [Clostridia bacterium]